VNMRAISGRDANDLYPRIVSTVMSEGKEVPSRNGATKEVHPFAIEMFEPRRRLVTSHGRPVNVAFALAEVLWILGGRNDVAMLEFYNTRIGDYSDNDLSFNAAYGHRMRHAHGHDQLVDVINTLRHDPGTRQAVLNIWHPSYDRGFEPSGEGLEAVPRVTKDRACNMLAHLMIRDGKLDWMQIVRSNDALWGVPYNWMQWTNIMEFIAVMVGVPMGSLFWIADSMHVYDYHWDEAHTISRFDLYQQEGGRDHPELTPLDDTGIEDLLAAEEFIRTHAPFDHGGVTYIIRAAREWYGDAYASWLEIFAAHRLYKDGENQACMRQLIWSGADPIYSRAAARFYSAMRWSKSNKHSNSLEQILAEHSTPLVSDWIMGK
jgi:thymidylate synthase